MTSVTSVFDPVDEPNGHMAHFVDQSVFESLYVRDFRVCGVCVVHDKQRVYHRNQ